jgi:hypothetical protein
MSVWRKGDGGPRVGGLPQIEKPTTATAEENWGSIQRHIGHAWGGRPELGKGGNVHYVLNAVLDFAEACQRFRSRVPLRARPNVPRHGDHHRP